MGETVGSCGPETASKAFPIRCFDCPNGLTWIAQPALEPPFNHSRQPLVEPSGVRGEWEEGRQTGHGGHPLRRKQDQQRVRLRQRFQTLCCARWALGINDYRERCNPCLGAQLTDRLQALRLGSCKSPEFTDQAGH